MVQKISGKIPAHKPPLFVAKSKPVTQMNIVEENRTEISELCKKYDVTELYVFGSVLDSTFSQDSDIDFLVEFNWENEKNLSSRFLNLKSELEQLFGRSVDLVCYSAIRNPYFRKSIESRKQVVYAA